MQLSPDGDACAGQSKMAPLGVKTRVLDLCQTTYAVNNAFVDQHPDVCTD